MDLELLPHSCNQSSPHVGLTKETSSCWSQCITSSSIACLDLTKTVASHRWLTLRRYELIHAQQPNQTIMTAKYIGPANPADIVDGTIKANPGDTFILELAMPGLRRFMAYQYDPVARIGERVWQNFMVLHCGNKDDCVSVAEFHAEAWGKIKRL